MKKRPIIFSALMVQALLDGRKTQTRRSLKPQPSSGARWTQIVVDGHGGWVDGHGAPLHCPYGQPGDLLRVEGAALTLRITDVRIERLKEISEEDTISEGWFPLKNEPPGNVWGFSWFANGWDSLYGPGTWDANPFVWVIGFKVVR